MELDLATVAVVVPHGKEPAKWYKEKLGFEISGDAEGHWVVVAPKGSTKGPQGPWRGIHLCEAEELEPGNTGILFLTADIKATVKEMKAKGVRFTREITKEPWGTYAMFADPYGNEFWLMPK